MKRSRVYCIVISIIIVALIQIATSKVVDYSLEGVIYSSIPYFVGIVVVTTAIEEIICRKNVRTGIIQAVTGICVTLGVLTLILCYFSTLNEKYKDISFRVFAISFICFWIFDALWIKEEQKEKSK